MHCGEQIESSLPHLHIIIKNYLSVVDAVIAVYSEFEIV
jgi:hypothetical protein